MLDFILGCVGLAFLGLMMFFAKYVIAGIIILTGSKEGLKEFGNLCEDEVPPPPQWYLNMQKERLWRRDGRPGKY